MPAVLSAPAAGIKITPRSSTPAPAALPASVRHAAAKATMELPFRLLDKEWFTLQEAAHLSGMGETFIEKKFDEGRQLSGHVHNAGAGQRMTKRIPRIWLVNYLVTTARYDEASLIAALLACVQDFTPPLRRRFIEELINA
jgi:hypothetical protein